MQTAANNRLQTRIKTLGLSIRFRHLRLWGGACLALATAQPTPTLAAFALIEATQAKATGSAVPGVETTDRIIMANEPAASAGATIEFDLSGLDQKVTPLARLPIELEKLAVKRPGEQANVERGVIHAYLVESDGRQTLVGSSHVKPGGATNLYTLDLTLAANRVLARPKGERKLQLAVRMDGKPAPYEVYALPPAMPVLEVAPSENWTDDWQKAVAPVTTAGEVYRESCLALTDKAGEEVTLNTLYPVKRVSEVIALGTGRFLKEGTDWIVRDGRIVLPPGSEAPIHVASDFFVTTKKDKDGAEITSKTSVKLVAGSWYHEQQIAVTYEPDRRDWNWPEAKSKLDQLPRTKELLSGGKPLRLIVFGDSISEGYDSSKKNGVWPYMPGYGELVARALESRYGAQITYMNHARAGGTASHATTQVDSQVAWFKPDLVLLAYGMNDRGAERRVVQRKNLEKIIDTVRARSPETEFVVITPMLNNPKQPTGLDPIKFIRDEELAIDRPGVAFVDITSTQLAMLDRKDYLDLSGNGANHPNDFLHRIYAQRILEVLAP